MRNGAVTSLSGIQENFGKAVPKGLQGRHGLSDREHGRIDGRKVEILEADDGSNPAQAASGATALPSQGAKILAGPISTGIGLHVADHPGNDALLLLSAGGDDFTGMSPNVFRTIWQTVQTNKAILATVPETAGKTILVSTQDTTFGTASVTGLSSAFGAVGATVESVVAPAAANDLIPFAQRAADATPTSCTSRGSVPTPRRSGRRRLLRESPKSRSFAVCTTASARKSSIAPRRA
jgi:branched-chain amino acid transport system substrate-binding protein